jgi:hypothetical protein
MEATKENGTAIVKAQPTEMAAIEMVLMQGDLAKLSSQQRVTYYNRVCESVGLNPLTRPFEYVEFQGKLRFYVRRDATDQLRKIHCISIKLVSQETDPNGIRRVVAQATTPNGRTDEDMGALHVAAMKGQDLANGEMKAITKAKRRVTLSICGLSFLDESEVDDMPGARKLTEEELDDTAVNDLANRILVFSARIQEAASKDALKIINADIDADPARDEIKRQLKDQYVAKNKELSVEA